MRIVLVNKFAYRKGGADRHCLDLLDLLKSAGHDVSVFGMRHPDNLIWPDNDLFVSKVDFEHPRSAWAKVRAAGRLLYSFEAKRKFGALLDRRKPDIVHVHNVYHQLSPSILGEAKKRNIPVVMTLHDLSLAAPNYLLFHDGAVCEITKSNRFFRAVGHRCVKNSRLGSFLCALETWLHRALRLYTDNVDLFISPSRFLEAKLREYQVPLKRIDVVPNFTPRSARPASGDQGYALYASRLSEEKGVAVLLEAWKQLPSIPLKIVGSGPEADRLRQLARESHLTNVEFIGHQTGPALDGLIAGARLVVVPSLCYENQPLSVLEAFQAGKPVVASAIGGIPELVEPGTNGLLFPPGNAGALAESVRTLWNDDGLRARMSAANMRKISEFAPDRYLARITTLYENLISGRTNRSDEASKALASRTRTGRSGSGQ